MKTRSRCAAASSRARETGSQLLELMMAMTILSVGAMGFLFATQANFRASRDVGTNDLVARAFVNAIETLKQADYSTVYGTYTGAYINPPTTSFEETGYTVGELVDPDGNAARVLVTFDIDETNLPAEYGPITDLDGDGQLATTNIIVGGNYRMLPARLTLTYQTSAGTQAQTVFMLLSVHG